MAIDASIYNAFKPETYGQRQERMMREQAAAQEREFNALRLQGAKAELADKDRMRQESLAVQNALMGATTDDDRISRLTALGTPTAWGQADTLRKGILERQKAEAENAYKQAQADRERLSTTKDKLGLVLNVVSAAKDPVSYQQGLQILQANGVDLAGVPPQFDPKYVANAGQQALTAMQRLEQEWKAKGYDLDVKRQEEAVRHNRTQEGLTARGQNMTDARARAQMAQSDAHFNAGMAEKRASASAQPKPGVPTEGERNAGGFASRMNEATKLLDEHEGKGTATLYTETLKGIPMVGKLAERVAMTPVQQQYKQAASDWIRAKLRKESGAVIGADEMQAEYETYFPMPGDSADVIKQKRQSRLVANRAMMQSAGRGAPAEQPQGLRVVRTGKDASGRKVEELSDGTIRYAD